jgi:hypothetical protein
MKNLRFSWHWHTEQPLASEEKLFMELTCYDWFFGARYIQSVTLNWTCWVVPCLFWQFISHRSATQWTSPRQPFSWQHLTTIRAEHFQDRLTYFLDATDEGYACSNEMPRQSWHENWSKCTAVPRKPWFLPIADFKIRGIFGVVIMCSFFRSKLKL